MASFGSCIRRIREARGQQLTTYPLCASGASGFPRDIGNRTACPVCCASYTGDASSIPGREHALFDCGGGWIVGTDWISGEKAWVGRCGRPLKQQEFAYD
jgi:hypothetical protein